MSSFPLHYLEDRYFLFRAVPSSCVGVERWNVRYAMAANLNHHFSCVMQTFFSHFPPVK